MIEIEKKFLLKGSEEEELLRGARLLIEKTVEDTYFDKDGYALTTQDIWLRRRDGAYELKVPLENTNGTRKQTNRYHEVTDTDEIAARIGISRGEDFESALAAAGVYAFVTSLSSRRSYEKDGFHIDIDDVSFRGSEFRYALAEIELLIGSEAEAAAAEQKIIEFAQRHHISTSPVVLGKIMAFLEVEEPEQYEALKKAHVI